MTRNLPRAHKALATAQQIHVAELSGYTVRHGFPSHEQHRLVQTVQAGLSGH